MMSSNNAYIAFAILFILLSHSLQVHSVVVECGADKNDGCTDMKKALPLKINAMVSILVTGMIGVCLPLVARSFPVLSPHRNLFEMIKAFAAGIILATVFVHILPNSLDMLSSACLKQNPWREFPFTGFVAMLSAIVKVMIDSMAIFYSKKQNGGVVRLECGGEREMAAVEGGHAHHRHHGHHHGGKLEVEGAQLLRYRVIVVVLELGIILQSIVLGLSLGVSNNTCSIKGLVAALRFLQMFKGMGLGGFIIQTEYKFIKKAAMALFFSLTTPFGIALGIALSKRYKENSPQSLITVGLLNASSAGLLIYTALIFWLQITWGRICRRASRFTPNPTWRCSWVPEEWT